MQILFAFRGRPNQPDLKEMIVFETDTGDVNAEPAQRYQWWMMESPSSPRRLLFVARPSSTRRELLDPTTKYHYFIELGSKPSPHLVVETDRHYQLTAVDDWEREELLRHLP